MATYVALSAAPADRYYWMRLGDQARTVVDEDGVRHKLAPKSRFGVRELRGKTFDEVLLEDGTRFKLSIRKSENLMDASKPYRGATPAAKKTPAKPSTTASKPAAKHAVKPQTPVRRSTPQKATPAAPVHHGVKLSQVEMPEVDDFTDDTLPEEFRRYQGSFSSGKKSKGGKLRINLSENG